MARQNWVEGLEITYEDLNNLSAGIEKTIGDTFITPLIGIEGFIGDGFKVVRDSATAVTVSQGYGYIINNSAVSPEPKLEPYYNDDDTTLYSITAADASLDRIDIIQVRAVLEDETSESREVMAIDETVSSSTVVVRKKWGVEISIKDGTAAASPTAPAADSGYTKLAEIYVTAATGIVDSAAITDSRTITSLRMAIGAEPYLDEFTDDDTWTAPAGVTRVKATVSLIKPITERHDIGSDTAVMIDRDGRLWGWGDSITGQVGDGTTTAKTTPVPLDCEARFKQVSIANDHTLALDIHGQIWSWGLNTYGQLGIGSVSAATKPTRVLSGKSFKMVSAGVNHSLAIDMDGNVWAWGRNNFGQLGFGISDATSWTIPYAAASGITAKFVAAGGSYSAVISTAGELYMFGLNTKGQCGTNNTVSPQETVVEMTQVASAVWDFVSLSDDGTTHAITDQGECYAWGEGSNYEFGDGNNTDRTAATQMGAGITWKQAKCNEMYCVGLATDGTGYGWGYSFAQQFLGVGATDPVTTPTELLGSYTWANVCKGVFGSGGYTTEGTIYAWGELPNNQIGAGATIETGTPTDTTYIKHVAIDTMELIAQRYIEVTPATAYAVTVVGGAIKLGDTCLAMSGGDVILQLEYEG